MQNPPAVQPAPPAVPEDADVPPPPEAEPAFLQPELRPAPAAVQPAAAPALQPVQAAAKPPAPKTKKPLEPFPQWSLVLADLEESDAMLISFLRGTKAYYNGTHVLFECSDAFRDYIRGNSEVSKKLKETIYKVTRISCGIGPYEPPQQDTQDPAGVSVDQTLQTMQALGVDVQIEEK